MGRRIKGAAVALAAVATVGALATWPAHAAGESPQGDTVAPPGMARMHELMMDGNPGMARMHELMTQGNPGMARMHELMMDGTPAHGGR